MQQNGQNMPRTRLSTIGKKGSRKVKEKSGGRERGTKNILDKKKKFIKKVKDLLKQVETDKITCSLQQSDYIDLDDDTGEISDAHIGALHETVEFTIKQHAFIGKKLFDLAESGDPNAISILADDRNVPFFTENPYITSVQDPNCIEADAILIRECGLDIHQRVIHCSSDEDVFLLDSIMEEFSNEKF